MTVNKNGLGFRMTLRKNVLEIPSGYILCDGKEQAVIDPLEYVWNQETMDLLANGVLPKYF